MEPESAKKQVVILDDHADIAVGVGQCIGACSDFSVLGIYSTLAALHEALKGSSAELLVMDLQLGDESIAPEIRELCYQYPLLKVLVFTFFDSRTHVHDAVAYGALGFLSKSSRQAQLLEGLQTVATNRHFFGADLGASVANIDDSEIPVKLLSDRELDVLKRLAMGSSPKEIGFELDLSDKTIHAHKNSIRQKLGVRRQSDLIRAAFSAGIVTVHDLVG